MINKILTFWLLVIMVSACAACGGTNAPPPDLVKPMSIKADMTSVTRGDVVRVNQIKGFVRVKSDKLAYGDTDLRFDEYFCVSGQRVEKGQLLARLDTKSLDKAIEAQETVMTRTQEDFAFENEVMELDIAIAQAEAAMLAQSANGYDEEAMKTLENKKIEVERLILALEQARERQSLTMQYQQVYMKELTDEAAAAELRAPYDGVITYIQEKAPGDYVEPFAALIFISDESELLVEYGSLSQVSVLKHYVLKGYIGSHEYDLERMTVSLQDQVYYANLGLTVPVRFTVLNPDELLTPGTLMTIRIYEEMAQDVLRVPSNAVYADVDIGRYLYVMEDGQKTIRTVEVGLRTDTYAEIISGAQEGEVVYVN